MKKLKLITALSAGIIGGGILISVPLITTNCGSSLKNQRISADHDLEPTGSYYAEGSKQYTTTATTIPTWSIASISPTQDDITIDETGLLE
jgi:hypothetical protein